MKTANWKRNRLGEIFRNCHLERREFTTRIANYPAAFCLALSASLATNHAEPSEDFREAAARRSTIWAGGIGNGFKRGAFEVGFSLGAGPGVEVFGSSLAHDLALSSVSAGWILDDVVGNEKWYCGNWELMGEFLSGAQFSPEIRYVVGFSPLIRYDFATGSRWVPFANGGFGGSATDIASPDLRGTFQFVTQVGTGTHYFLTKNTALTIEHRWFHLSNAHTRHPNHGTNTEMFTLGMSLFF